MMKVGALGPEGTFSHELAMKLHIGEVVLLPTIHRADVDKRHLRVEGRSQLRDRGQNLLGNP